MRRQFVLTRDVLRAECPWLSEDHHAGDVVHEFTGHTYGCISPSGIAVSAVPGEHPFFEVPRDAIVSHLSECFLLNFPDDKGVCTCGDWADA